MVTASKAAGIVAATSAAVITSTGPDQPAARKHTPTTTTTATITGALKTAALRALRRVIGPTQEA